MHVWSTAIVLTAAFTRTSHTHAHAHAHTHTGNMWGLLFCLLGVVVCCARIAQEYGLGEHTHTHTHTHTHVSVTCM